MERDLHVLPHRELLLQHARRPGELGVRVSRRKPDDEGRAPLEVAARHVPSDDRLRAPNRLVIGEVLVRVLLGKGKGLGLGWGGG